ncbi:MAG: hypothetical protein JSW33_01240 [bacterium]|nr:MAG: hypothetical protein JSW33_01240 [bacterium]
MKINNKFFFLMMLFLLTGISLAQQYHLVFVKQGNVLILPDTLITARKDTIIRIPDDIPYQIRDATHLKSNSFYDSLGRKTRNNKLTNLLYRSLVVSNPFEMADSIDFQQSESEFMEFKGKIIGKIRLKKVRVLAGSVYDTLEIVETSFSDLLNTLHYSTRDGVIKNNLLFHEGETVDPYLLSDNERILRELPFIEDAKLKVVIREEDDDVVDIIVITKDLFSLGISPSVLDVNRARVAFFDRNFLGYGTELRYTLHYDQREQPKFGHEGKYAMTNIRGTFVSGLLNYENSFEGTFTRILFERFFFTPQIRYAGAMDLGYFITSREEFSNDTLVENSYSADYEDIWLGRSFQIGEEFSRRNIILSGRVRNDNFRRRPVVEPDSNLFYQDNLLLLASLSFREIHFFKSSMILAFGKTEDIPIGFRLQLTGGYETEEFAYKSYTSVEIAWAKLWENFGYLGNSIRFGNFWKDRKLIEGIFKARMFYFSPLTPLKRFRFRQIVYADWTYGLNRLQGEYISLSDQIRGLDGSQFQGVNRFIINAESITFAPWNFYGFRFAFYGFGDMGFLSDRALLFHQDNFYGSFGVGCRIRNESLVLKTVQIRIGYFTRTPDRFGEWKVDIDTRDPSLFIPIESTRPSIIGFE